MQISRHRVYIAIILFIFRSSLSLGRKFKESTTNHVDLINNVQKFYGIVSIALVYDNEDDTSPFIAELLKQLSESQRYAISLRIADLSAKYSQLTRLHSKILFYVLIRKKNDLRRYVDFANDEKLDAHVWLMIFSSSSSSLCRSPIDDHDDLRFDFLNFGVQMLVRCDDDREIKEWYSVGDDKKIVVKDYFEFVTNDDDDDDEHRRGTMVLKNHPVLYERRRDLNGLTARTAVVGQPDNNDSDCREFMPKVVSELSSVMKIDLDYQTPSSIYGTWNKTKQRWTGILGRLSNNSIDIAVAEMIITKERDSTFDFTVPIIVSRAQLFIQTPDTADVPWNAYLKTFSKGVWIVLVLFIVVSPIVLTCININANGGRYRRHFLLDNYMHVWSIYCQQGLTDHSRTPPMKLAYFSIFLSAYLLMSVYSGSLTSYVTVSMPTMPFNDVGEFIKAKSYKLIVLKNSAEHDSFLNPSDDAYYQMSLLMKSYDKLPSSYIDGFQQVCNEKIAFFASMVMHNKIHGAITCGLANVPADKVRKMGIALNKHDPLTKFFNHYIQRFEESGIMAQMKRNYEKKLTRPKEPFDAFDMRDVKPLFAIFMCGVLASVVVIIIEWLHYKFHSR